MSKNKLIRKIALIAMPIFFIAILILIMQIPYRSLQNKKRVRALDNHISDLIENHQEFLNNTAKKITSMPVDPRIISEIQSEILHKETDIKLYLWLINNNGAFIFGVPKTVFLRLNTAYDKYYEIIKNDGNFINRNDFLSKLVSRHDEIDFSEFEASNRPKYSDNDWRYYKESKPNLRYYLKSYYFQLSTPATGEAGEYLGELYLKVDDSPNKQIYYGSYYAERNDLYALLNPIFGALAFFSGLVLWFLLPTWVYIDAQQRDVKNPGLWAFLTLVSAIFGLIIYLITRPQALKSLNCPQCDKELNGTKAYCPYCGFDVSTTFCSQCQYPVKPDWSFCPACRSELKKGDFKTVEEKGNSDEVSDTRTSDSA